MSESRDLVDRFVETFPLLDPSACDFDDDLGRVFHGHGDMPWHPVRSRASDAAVAEIRGLGAFPLLFQELISRYRWPPVDLSVCRLLPNLPCENLRPLADAMLADPVLNESLSPAGLVRFGLAPNESYDAICFDLGKSSRGECPIVRVEHEEILMHGSLGAVETIFGSFRSFMESVIDIAKFCDNDRA